MSILFYGNCQTYAIADMLLIDNYKLYKIECHNTDITENEFKNIINECDIIITQQISETYKNKHYLSTKFIVDNINSNAIVIIIDSCYFNFYYFDLTYKDIDGTILHKPADYHYNKLIECYKNNFSKDYYVNNFVNNVNLLTSEDLDKIAQESLDNLHDRFFKTTNKYKTNTQIYIISSYDYIKENFKNKLLFYSMNHPSKYLLQYICEEIVKIAMNIKKISCTINYDIDPLSNPKCILYKCIQNVVNFDINTIEPLLDNTNTVDKIIDIYYNTYSQINL